jgi:hypothetical protein
LSYFSDDDEKLKRRDKRLLLLILKFLLVLGTWGASLIGLLRSPLNLSFEQYALIPAFPTFGMLLCLLLRSLAHRPAREKPVTMYSALEAEMERLGRGQHVYRQRANLRAWR